MDTNWAARLEQIISADRLRRYRDAANSDFDTLVLYCWNIQLAEALMPPLSILEVTLRNAVHSTLMGQVHSEFWFKSILHQQKYDNIAELISRITKRQGYPPTAGKIISEITFGFWPLIFAKHYNSLWWSQPHPLLASVIPNHPNLARDTRSKFAERLAYCVSLRNRVMHQEAIFQGVAALNRPVLPIEVLHDHLLEVIGWINQDALSMVLCLDRFNALFRQEGRSELEARLKSSLDIP